MVELRRGGASIGVLAAAVVSLFACPGPALAVSPPGPTLIAPEYPRFVSTHVEARDVGKCADAGDVAACIIAAIEHAAPDTRDEVALAPLTDDGVTSFGGQLSGSDWAAAYRKMLISARGGGDPKAALKRLDGMSPSQRTWSLMQLCMDSDHLALAGAGPRYAAWEKANRPSPDLVAAGADALENSIKADPGGAEVLVFPQILATCRAGLGDRPGMERALALASMGGVGLRLQVLSNSGRLDEALALAQAATAAPADAKAPPAVQWIALQHGREQLLWAAASSGNVIVADQAADIILRGAFSQDRPIVYSGDTGVPAALAWIMSREDAGQAAARVQQADAFVRPGMPDWNYDDAAAVYGAWLRLGKDAQALALYDVVAAEAATAPEKPEDPAANPAYAAALANGSNADKVARIDAMIAAQAARIDPRRAQRALGQMLVLSGRVDEARALFAFGGVPIGREIRLNMTPAAIDDLAAKADTVAEKSNLYRNCALSITSSVMPGVRLPLDLSAHCVRELAALSRQGGETPRSAGRFDWLVATNPALVVAARAAQADRPELVHEMMAILLPLWRSPETGHMVLNDQSVSLLILVAATDLYMRGRT
jgi:hypothetical protein